MSALACSLRSDIHAAPPMDGVDVDMDAEVSVWLSRIGIVDLLDELMEAEAPLKLAIAYNDAPAIGRIVLAVRHAYARRLLQFASHDDLTKLLRFNGSDLANEAANRIDYLSAQEDLLQTWQDKHAHIAAELAEMKRPLDAQMARLNAALIEANRAVTALLASLKRCSFLLNSARLLIEDKQASDIAGEAVAEAQAVIQRAEGR